MLNNFLNKFKQLPKSNKSMIYLNWIYNVGWIISLIFINIYVFSLNKEILDVLIYNLVFILNVFIGFVLVGYLISVFSKNIKNLYYFAYIFFVLAFLFIFLFSWIFWTLFFAVIYWLWFWMFWCSVHSQELANIKDEKRDIYSSLIYSWKTFIGIIIPFLIALIFYLVEKYFNFNPYIVLFLFLPFIYIFSFLFIKDIWDYFPEKIKKKDLKKLFNVKKTFFSNLYFLLDWFLSGIYWSIFPIIAIYLLKTEINVWLLESFMWFLSVFVIILLSSKRKVENRLKMLGISSILISINAIILLFNFSTIWYIIFSLFAIILNPLYKTSEHVFKLKLIDNIKLKWRDFFLPMLLREFNLWFWRTLIVLFFIFLVYIWFELENILKIWLILVVLFFILTVLAIFLHEKYDNKN